MCFGSAGILGEGAVFLFLRKSNCHNGASTSREERIHVVTEKGKKKLFEE